MMKDRQITFHLRRNSGIDGENNTRKKGEWTDKHTNTHPTGMAMKV